MNLQINVSPTIVSCKFLNHKSDMEDNNISSITLVPEKNNQLNYTICLHRFKDIYGYFMNKNYSHTPSKQ